jgi:hypothetical protein
MDARMLIISVSPDLSASYIPIMNSIFAAQKLVRNGPPDAPLELVLEAQLLTVSLLIASESQN